MTAALKDVGPNGGIVYSEVEIEVEVENRIANTEQGILNSEVEVEKTDN